MAKRKADIKKWFLAIGIAIVLNLFVNYGIETFYPGPDYREFCDNEFARTPFLDRESCPEPPEITEDERQTCADQEGYIDYTRDANGCALETYCNTCQVEFDNAREPRDANVFLFLVGIGVAVLIAGVLLKNESVSAGLLLGGILSIIIGTMRQWGSFTDLVRFILLGVVLALLIYIGYKKLR